jgi:hypothetical protein
LQEYVTHCRTSHLLRIVAVVVQPSESNLIMWV